MYETFEVEGGYGFRIGSLIQEFYPFREGFQPMTREEAEYIAQCFDTPAGVHWTGSEVVPRLVLTADKRQMVADGVDQATITATVVDPADADPVTFTVEGEEPVEVPLTDGQASLSLGFGAGNEGQKTVVVTHPRYGRNEVRLEVVGSE